MKKTPSKRVTATVAAAPAIIAIMSLYLVGMPAPSVAASFHCGASNSVAEKIVCSDAELSGLDDRLGKTYQQARAKAADRRDFIARSEGFWRWREKNCVTRDCLIDWYRQRQQDLDRELAQAGGATRASPPSSAAPGKLPALPAQSVTPAQIAAALSQVKPAPPSPVAPLQPHYVAVAADGYLYDDPGAVTPADLTPQATVRYLGRQQGHYTLEVQRKTGKIRYSCDSDCNDIKQLTLPGYGLHDLDVIRNDHVSLAPVIMRDAMNGLLVESSR